MNSERNDGIVCDDLKETSVVEIPNYKEIDADDVIVFGTDSITAYGIREVVKSGFPITGTGYNGESVMTISSDPISARWGTEYFFKLAKAIAYTISKEVYVRIRRRNFKVTADEITSVASIPLPITFKNGFTDKPSGKGWLGATRLTLVDYVTTYKNNAIFERLKRMAGSGKPSEKREVARKILNKANISFEQRDRLTWAEKHRV